MSDVIDVLAIKGAPGVGKSSAAKSLAPFFPRGVKIEVDILRKMVVSVDWKNQAEHIALLQVAARLTHDFLQMGYRPAIVVDTFSGDKIHRFLEDLKKLDGVRTAKVFSLYVSDLELQRRLQARPADEFKDFGISAKLNADVQRLRHPSEYQIDSTDLTPEEIAGRIYQLIV